MSSPRVPAHWYASLVILPFTVWWLGFYPGFGHTDTFDQWAQLKTEVISNYHPAIHTIYLDVLSLDGSRPGLVTAFQLIALAALLVYAAKWLIRAGVPSWLAVGTMILLGLSPAIPPTTMALWKDVPFALFCVWAWVELLALGVDEDRRARTLPWVRLGVALSGVWLFRANGILTALGMLIVLAWVYRRHGRQVALAAGTIAIVVAAVTGPLYQAREVRESAIEPVEALLPEIAASLIAKPATFDANELALLETLAPIEVWTGEYDCYESNGLLFHPLFDHEPVRADPGPYRSLFLEVLVRDPASVMRHRLCASHFVYVPAQPEDAFFHRPPYDFPPNEVGLQRKPISDRAFAVTDRYWRWAEPDEVLWLTWRPAIVVLSAVATTILLALSPTGRRLLPPALLFTLHVVNVMVTSPVQEFRYAYPLYLMGWLTLLLAFPALAGWRKARSAASQPEAETTV
jgi:hypothetical protein